MAKKKPLKNNELEMLLTCCAKALDKIIVENPKAGIIVDKGLVSETRMKYSDARKALKKLDTYFGLRGTSSIYSFGICLTCTKWSTASFSSVEDCCGKCTAGNKATNYHGDILHAYDSCKHHSKEGGGNGL